MLSLYSVVYWLIDTNQSTNQQFTDYQFNTLSAMCQPFNGDHSVCHYVPGEYVWCTFNIQRDIQNFTSWICDVELIKGCPFTPFTEVSLMSLIQNMIVDL